MVRLYGPVRIAPRGSRRCGAGGAQPRPGRNGRRRRKHRRLLERPPEWRTYRHTPARNPIDAVEPAPVGSVSRSAKRTIPSHARYLVAETGADEGPVTIGPAGDPAAVTRLADQGQTCGPCRHARPVPGRHQRRPSTGRRPEPGRPVERWLDEYTPRWRVRSDDSGSRLRSPPTLAWSGSLAKRVRPCSPTGSTPSATPSPTSSSTARSQLASYGSRGRSSVGRRSRAESASPGAASEGSWKDPTRRTRRWLL
jgi:hypothetical protein